MPTSPVTSVHMQMSHLFCLPPTRPFPHARPVQRRSTEQGRTRTIIRAKVDSTDNPADRKAQRHFPPTFARRITVSPLTGGTKNIPRPKFPDTQIYNVKTIMMGGASPYLKSRGFSRTKRKSLLTGKKQTLVRSFQKTFFFFPYIFFPAKKNPILGTSLHHLLLVCMHREHHTLNQKKKGPL